MKKNCLKFMYFTIDSIQHVYKGKENSRDFLKSKSTRECKNLRDAKKINIRFKLTIKTLVVALK